jgi:leucyl-tRNA synthetase
LPIQQVIRPEDKSMAVVLPFVSEEGVLINSGEFDGLSCAQAEKRMQEVAAAKGFGEATVTYRLKDWGVSRQRYWGTPIPMVYCLVSLPGRRADPSSRRPVAGAAAGAD